MELLRDSNQLMREVGWDDGAWGRQRVLSIQRGCMNANYITSSECQCHQTIPFIIVQNDYFSFELFILHHRLFIYKAIVCFQSTKCQFTSWKCLPAGDCQLKRHVFNSGQCAELAYLIWHQHMWVRPKCMKAAAILARKEKEKKENNSTFSILTAVQWFPRLWILHGDRIDENTWFQSVLLYHVIVIPYECLIGLYKLHSCMCVAHHETST